MTLELSEQRIQHIKTFVAEMKDMLPLDIADNDLTLDYAMRGLGWYTARTDLGIYIMIGIPGQRVRVGVEYTMTVGVPDPELQRIAQRHGVLIYHVMEDGVLVGGPTIIGLRGVEMFPYNGPALTFDAFVETYLFKVSRAAQEVRLYQAKSGRDPYGTAESR